MSRSIESRIAKLEEHRKPRAAYVVRLSDPPTAAESSEIEYASQEGRWIAVLPHKCASIDEWVARHGRLQ